MTVQTGCNLEQTKNKYNAKLFFKEAIDWYNDLLLALRRNIPKKRALKTTIKNPFQDPTSPFYKTQRFLK